MGTMPFRAKVQSGDPSSFNAAFAKLQSAIDATIPPSVSIMRGGKRLRTRSAGSLKIEGLEPRKFVNTTINFGAGTFTIGYDLGGLEHFHG